MQWASRRELRDWVVAGGAPREIGEKRFVGFRHVRGAGMVVSCVGLSAAEMKVLRTFRDDMSTFTRLLRGLGPLGDAFSRMTYEDSGARLVF
jgi:hypothetical protein